MLHLTKTNLQLFGMLVTLKLCHRDIDAWFSKKHVSLVSGLTSSVSFIEKVWHQSKCVSSAKYRL